MTATITTPAITWKRYSSIYTGTTHTGTMAGTGDYYVVSKRDTKWECWIAGQYLGRFPTMRAAKARAADHRASVTA